MRYLYIFIPVLVAIMTTSCQKNFLTRDNPTSTTDEQWWTTDAELQSALAVVYGGMPAGCYQYTPNSYASFSGETDDAEWHANYFSEINIVAQGNATPDLPLEKLSVVTNAIYPLWQTDYAMIRDANRFIEHAAKAYDDSTLIKRYIMEARALRAWYHLDLFLYYGANIPLVTTSVTPDASAQPAAGLNKLIPFITSELEACAEVLPVSYPSANDRYRITKGTCLTLEAWAFLNAHMYPEAAAAAKKVIDLGVYHLYYNTADSADSYRDLFLYTGSSNTEVIWRSQKNYGCYLRFGPASAGGSTNLSPTASLVNTYETLQGKTLDELGPDSTQIYEEYPNYLNNRDPRLAGSIFCPGDSFEGMVLNPFNSSPSNRDRLNAVNSTVTGYWARKYVDPQDKGHPSTSSLDFLLFRYADVLLMYAEAEVESGNWQDPQVITYLNMIRRRAGMPDVNVLEYNSQEKMRQLYRRERRVELSFEGSRLFDIRRWGIGNQVMNGTVYGATNPETGQIVTVENRQYADKNNVWPIPIQEITSNPALKQNPGY